jgi:hypothetical protein
MVGVLHATTPYPDKKHVVIMKGTRIFQVFILFALLKHFQFIF